jgi:hypothetical protein
MPSNKLVDGDFLAKLLQNSFEVRLGQVEDVVREHESLFGGTKDVDVQCVGTFSEHAIVMNSAGQFFRATIKDDADKLSLDEVEEIDVPVFEASELRGQVREHSDNAVDSLLKGKGNGAYEDIISLYELVKSGVPLTAEAVEQALDDLVGTEVEWISALRENEKEITGFLGVDAKRESPTRRFTAISEAEHINDMSRTRTVVVHGLREMRIHLDGLDAQTVLARQVDETYELSGDGGMGAADFIEFIEEFDEDLQAVRSVVEDAITVSDEGTVKSLARIHDGVAGRAVDLTMAASFAEKFARRFSAPAAA